MLVFPAAITRSLPPLLGAAGLRLGRTGIRNRQTMLTSQSRETSGRVSAHKKKIHLSIASYFTSLSNCKILTKKKMVALVLLIGHLLGNL